MTRPLYRRRGAVIHLRIGLAEVKCGGDKLTEEGTHTLKPAANKTDTAKMKKPSFFMVLTGTPPPAYQRFVGVYFVLIPALNS